MQRKYQPVLIFAASLTLVCSLIGEAKASPIADYSFDDGTANDQSGNGNDATVFGATPTTDRFGIPNSAFFFDGIDDYIQTPIDSNVTPSSFSVWFRADTSTGERSIVDSDVGGRFGHSLIIDYALAPPTGGNLDVQFHNGAADTGALINPGDWNHGVVNYGSDIEVYLNNNLVYSQPYTPPFLDGSDFRFGRHNAFDPQWFNGAIDDVKFFDQTLSASEVNDLFTTSVPEPSSILSLLSFIGFGIGAVVRNRTSEESKT